MERMDLGQIIALLKHCPKDNPLRFDFGALVPTTCDSYRGFRRRTIAKSMWICLRVVTRWALASVMCSMALLN